MTKIANKGFRGAFESKRLFDLIPNYRTSPSLQDCEPLTSSEKFKIASEDAFDRGTRILVISDAGQETTGRGPATPQSRSSGPMARTQSCREKGSRMDMRNVTWHYHYRGIQAPTGSGTQETFDLGMSISRVTRNVKVRGPGMAKTLGPKEIRVWQPWSI